MKVTNYIAQIKKYLFFVELMPKNHTDPSGESNLLSPMSGITFWEKGEMAFTALRRINEHKANNELEKAQIMIDEWIL